VLERAGEQLGPEAAESGSKPAGLCQQRKERVMGLTISNGPLSRQDAAIASNYRIDGPEHLLLFADFPRRVRAVFADVAVLDITRGRLLHETGSLPVLYVPEDDVTASVLQPADHVTQSDATHWTVEVGNRTAENAF